MRAQPIDTTLSASLLYAPTAIDADVLAELVETFPLYAVPTACPVLPPGAYARAALEPLLAACPVLEPVDGATYRHTLNNVPAGEDRVIVDPRGFPLGTPPETAETAEPVEPAEPTDGWTREAVAWIPPSAARPLHERIAETLDALAPHERLRVIDPYGLLIPSDAAAISLDHAKRLTLGPEDRRGVATAVARAAPKHTQVLSGLLGLGPRTGRPATELLVAPAHAERLRDAAERVGLAIGHRIPATHPLWGERRNEAAEPFLLDATYDWTPRPNPATLPHILDLHLADWGIDVPPAERQRILARLSARLRPGERLDGPVLYALLATELDLKGHATKRSAVDGHA